jgi:hypothetical protein
MEREWQLEQETMVGEPPGHITGANPVGNALFSGVENMTIYGGRFVQSNVTKRDKGSWIVSKV